MTSATKTTFISTPAWSGARSNPYATGFGQMNTSLPSSRGARAC
jgi:hypothetical protein